MPAQNLPTDAPTYATLSANLLSDAADFFLMIAEENSDVTEEMTTNANTFKGASALLRADPTGATGQSKHKDIAAALLGDASRFFRALAKDNKPIAEQMNDNADVYDHIAKYLKKDPLAVMVDE